MSTKNSAQLLFNYTIYLIVNAVEIWAHFSPSVVPMPVPAPAP